MKQLGYSGPMPITLYHNPQCSKSRAALALLEKEADLRVVDYLSEKPSREKLRELAGKLGLKPREFLRTGEPVLATLAPDLNDDEAVLAAMAAHPILIERPILENEESAVVGRPPEKILEFLGQR